MTRHQESESQAPLLRQDKIPWGEILGVASLGIPFTAVWAVYNGKYLSWDMRNYEYYSVYAWLYHRVTYHIAPGQLQNWINPLVYLPHYLLINHAPPRLTGALFGAIGGLNFILIYALTRCVVTSRGRALAAIVGLLSAAVGISGPEFLEELGGASGDITISILVLAALLVICRSLRLGLTSHLASRKQDLGYALTGILMGAACGLKLTSIVYAAGLTASLIVLWQKLKFGAFRFVLYSLGGLAGFLLTGGYWSWFLWREYGNPIFPYYNEVFHSSWTESSNFRDLRFLPPNILSATSLPFQWLMGRNPTSESPFRDVRFALLCVLLPLSLAALLWRAWRRRSGWLADLGVRRPGILLPLVSASGPGQPPAQPRPGPDLERRVNSPCEPANHFRHLIGRDHFALLTLFFVTSFAVWLKMFAIQRYLAPLGLISGLLLFVLLDRLRKIAWFAALVLFAIAWDKSFPGERFPFGRDWFGIRPIPAASLADSLFIMIGDAPIGYVVPFLPATSRVVRLNSNMPLRLDTELGHQAMEVITRHDGPIRSLGASPLTARDRSQLSDFGLIMDQTKCEVFRSDADEFTVCPLIRMLRKVDNSRGP